VRSDAVSRRYAQAAFEVAREQGGDLDLWLSQIRELADTVSDKALMSSLRSPGLPNSAKLAALQQGFPDLLPGVANLLKLLLAKRRIVSLPGIAEAFADFLDDHHGRSQASIISARTLQAEELASIQEHLNRRTGRAVRLETAVDPSLIGGIVIRVGDELIDASVASRLERLRQSLA
jgi:F-type H+-transporting ATPase subunit delta